MFKNKLNLGIQDLPLLICKNIITVMPIVISLIFTDFSLLNTGIILSIISFIRAIYSIPNKKTLATRSFDNVAGLNIFCLITLVLF